MGNAIRFQPTLSASEIAVTVGCAPLVGVAVAAPGVRVGVLGAVDVRVAVGVLVRVTVGVAVLVGLGVLVRVAVGVLVRVLVAVAVGVGVGVLLPRVIRKRAAELPAIVQAVVLTAQPTPYRRLA